MRTRLLPTLLPALFVLPLALPAQDLWNDRAEIFTDARLWPAGTPVTVQFDQQLVANYQAALNRSVARNAGGAQVTGALFDFIPQAGVRDNGTENLTIKAQSAPQFKGSLTGLLGPFDPAAQTYAFSAVQTLAVNGRTETFQLTGVLQRRDVGPDRTVASRRIGNPTLTWNGFKSSKTRAFTPQDFRNFSFAGTNAADAALGLTEDKKRALFLEAFNAILEQLF